MANQNLEHIGEYHLDIHTANGQRSGTEFRPNGKLARLRAKALRESGYVVTLFKVTETGGLLQTR